MFPSHQHRDDPLLTYYWSTPQCKSMAQLNKSTMLKDQPIPPLTNGPTHLALSTPVASQALSDVWQANLFQ